MAESGIRHDDSAPFECTRQTETSPAPPPIERAVARPRRAGPLSGSDFQREPERAEQVRCEHRDPGHLVTGDAQHGEPERLVRGPRVAAPAHVRGRARLPIDPERDELEVEGTGTV